MADLRGNCLCGAIAFEYTGPIHGLQACHCLRCRKFYGIALGPIAIINREGFASSPASERVNRYFCRAGDGAQHEVWPPNEDMDERFRDLTE
jgi:hypothetical protein